jgi:hypothetical protein
MSELAQSPNNEISQSAVADRRWDELKFIQETLHKVWSAYLLYFIWFHTAVYGALSYLLGTGAKQPSKELTIVVATVCTISEILTIAVTVALGMYSRKVLRRADAIVKDGNFHSGLDAKIILPKQVLDATVPACILSFALAAFACLLTAWQALK